MNDNELNEKKPQVLSTLAAAKAILQDTQAALETNREPITDEEYNASQDSLYEAHEAFEAWMKKDSSLTIQQLAERNAAASIIAELQAQLDAARADVVTLTSRNQQLLQDWKAAQTVIASVGNQAKALKTALRTIVSIINTDLVEGDSPVMTLLDQQVAIKHSAINALAEVQS